MGSVFSKPHGHIMGEGLCGGEGPQCPLQFGFAIANAGTLASVAVSWVYLP